MREAAVPIPMPNVSTQALADEMILRLNVLIMDPAIRYVVQDLMSRRVSVPETIRNHATIQTHEGADGIAWVGFLGMLNGLVGCVDEPASGLNGWGFITASMTEDGRLVRFERSVSAPEG